jgi:hypothetical protein
VNQNCNKIIEMIKTGLVMKVIYFLLLAMFTSVSGFSQKGWIHNLPNYDKQPLHFGFSLGINTADFRITYVPNFKDLDTVLVIESESQSGLNLGIISNIRMGNRFDLRMIPALSFASRTLEYTINSNGIKKDPVVKKVESTFVELPVNIKFKSNRVKNYRIYTLGGFKYSIDMVSQEKVKAEDKQLVKISKHDFGLEYGLGIDLYFELFKLSPEIKLFRGMNNLLVREDNVFVNSIAGLKSSIFLVSFNFE